MAIATGTTAAQAKNVDMRNACVKVSIGLQKLVQNSSNLTAAEITAIQTDITALKAAFTAAGA